MKSAISSRNFVVVEPRLWNMEGHEFEHVLEFSKGIKQYFENSRVIVLSGKQDATLCDALNLELSIDTAIECFPRRMISDSSSVFSLLQSSFTDSLSLAKALRRICYKNQKKVTLIFSSLALYHFLLLAFTRLLMPLMEIKALSIFRYDPMDSNNRLRKKYFFFAKVFPVNLLWKIATRNTKISVDSFLLQDILFNELGAKSSLAPIPTTGIWKIEKEEPSLLKPTTNQLPLTIGYIGQPRPSRGFELFANVASAMEKERLSGLVKFIAVIPSDSDKFWNTRNSADLLRYNLVGISLEERLMDSKDFAFQMSQVDVVWALGDPDIYRRQTSGIVVHAVCLGKLVITNKGGWAES